MIYNIVKKIHYFSIITSLLLRYKYFLLFFLLRYKFLSASSFVDPDIEFKTIFMYLLFSFESGSL
jgi:hypothetical protein